MRFFLFIFISAGLLCFLVIGCQASQEAVEVPQTKTLTIDGQLDDWTTPFIKVPNQESFSYNVATDKNNLYLALRLSDKGLQRRLMNLGMTIFIDTTAKRRENIGLGYPLALTSTELEKVAFAATKNGISVDERALMGAYADIAQEFELLGFVEEDPRERIRVSNLASRDIKTALGQDQLNALLIEYKIPFRQFYQRPLTQITTWSIGIQINNPEADAGDDPGLFDDPSSNPITRSAQAGNPMLPNNNALNPRRTQPIRRGPMNALKVWTRLELSPAQ